jgi:polar amino acid transport system permease protein
VAVAHGTRDRRGAEMEQSDYTVRAVRTLRTALILAVVGIVTFSLIPAVIALVLIRRAEQDLAESGELQANLDRIATIRRAATLGIYLGILGVLFMIVFLAQNGLSDAQRTFFNGEHLSGSADTVLKGFWLDIQAFIMAELIVLPLALGIALLRALPGRAAAPLRVFAIAFVDLFRGLPAIVTIFLVGFGLPIAFPTLINDNPVNDFFFGSPQVSLLALGVIALSLVYSAYVAEVYRSGIESVHWSQTAAARSLGLSHGATMRHVIVPQAIRRVIPPLLNDFIGLQKDTALLTVIGLLDGFGRSKIYASNKFNVSSVVLLGLCYVVITIPMTRFADWMIRRDQRRTRATG